jgi:hypothetical protein
VLKRGTGTDAQKALAKNRSEKSIWLTRDDVTLIADMKQVEHYLPAVLATGVQRYVILNPVSGEE